LKIGADYLKRLNPDAKVYISDPSWENHRALFESAGFVVESYPYYDAATRGVNFDGMKACLNGLPAGSIILLHACCHNPTGADLSDAQWGEIVAICQNRGLVPFLDMAYQGFADGIDADAVAVRAFSVSGLQFFASSSFSKTFRCMASALVRSPSLPPARMNRLGSCRSCARYSHQLLQSAYTRRCFGCWCAGFTGTAPDVGNRTRRHA
jgi:aspartate/tyrosine/aromatic aminotransferase